MNTAQRIAQLHASAVGLDTKWPHGDALTGVVYHVYTQGAAPGDEAMLILSEALYLRGGKAAVCLHDAGSERNHNLSTIPSVVVEVDGTVAYRHDVRGEADHDIVRLLAVGGLLDPTVIRANLKAAQDAQVAATLADEEELINQQQMALAVADAVSNDPSLSLTAKAFFGALLPMVPPELIAPAARQMLDAVKAAEELEKPV